MRKKIVAYTGIFQEMYFSKDIFLIPFYIAKTKGIPLEVCFSEYIGENSMPKEHRGVKIKRQKKNNVLAMFSCIVAQAWTIDTLFLNGCSAKHMLMVRLYKLLYPKGKIVVFGDMERPQAEEFADNGLVYSSGLLGLLKKGLVRYFFNHVSYLVANTEAFYIMKDLCDRKGWKVPIHFYPGLDDELFYQYGMERIPFEKKEKMIICVGRIGNYQKNTEMLFEALEQVKELGDWKIYMIGPITASFDLKDKGDFHTIIDNFFKLNPRYRGKLFFTGMIYEQKELFTYFNRAKVLLSTARHEGFANVYSQAAAFGCYIISTDVGGADVGSNQWHFGTKIVQEDSEKLANVLNSLVNDELNMDASFALPFENMCYSKRILDII